MKKNLMVWITMTGAAGFIACALVTWLSILAPSSSFAAGASNVMPLSAPHAIEAEQALARKDFAAAIRYTRAELAISPVRTDAWLRLAEIDAMQHDRLTSLGAAALDQSYDAAPYDFDPTTRRLPFALAHFGDLPLSSRLTVSDELGVWSSSPVLRKRLAVLAAQTLDPAGRAAINSALTAQAPMSR